MESVSPSLHRAVREQLRDHPQGISEYQLLQRLSSAGLAPFAELDFHDSLALFRAHFLLFNLLYRMDEALTAEGLRLDIDPLCIAVRPLPPGGATAVSGHDPLRAYYSDLDNLRATDADEVEAMLEAFWTGHGRHSRRAEALAVLGLRDPVDDAAIRQAYRRLAMAHHPDRGGDTARLQAINEAARVLLGR